MVSNVEKQIDDNVREFFKPPIYYNTKCCSLSTDIVSDLELVETYDDDTSPVYDYMFGENGILGNLVRDDMVRLYSTDIKYIKDTQKLLKTKIDDDCKCDTEKSYKCWKSLKSEKDFKDKYHYVEWDRFSYLNKNELFLQIMSVYNLSSPVISLLLPIFVCIIPLFVLFMKGVEITITEYINILKTVLSRHSLGRLFTSFGDATPNEKAYMLVSAGMYLLSFYQNTQICIRAYKNMFHIHDTLDTILTFIKSSVSKMKNFVDKVKEYTTYSKFREIVMEHIEILTSMQETLEHIPPFGLSYHKLTDMGYVLSCFYKFYDDPIYNKSMSYAFGFVGYNDNMNGIRKNIDDKYISYGTLSTKKGTKLVTKHMYHPSLVDRKHVKNTITLKKDGIITGPNASGKTTILKSLMLNIIFTQQYGCGYYSSFKCIPYKHLHCYLNIPDTSGRDSLFQSESRKCKEILDTIQRTKSERHFCLFDELYSGTNPREAVKCGHAYLSLLSEYPNVNYLLTTHYIEICNLLKKSNNVANYKMLCELSETDGKLKYTYQIKKGINKLDGGVEVLRRMQYPKEILERC